MAARASAAFAMADFSTAILSSFNFPFSKTHLYNCKSVDHQIQMLGNTFTISNEKT
jgi:hypothetical protein